MTTYKSWQRIPFLVNYTVAACFTLAFLYRVVSTKGKYYGGNFPTEFVTGFDLFASVAYLVMLVFTPAAWIENTFIYKATPSVLLTVAVLAAILFARTAVIFLARSFNVSSINKDMDLVMAAASGAINVTNYFMMASYQGNQVYLNNGLGIFFTVAFHHRYWN